MRRRMTLAGQLLDDGPASEIVANPRAALERARELATRSHGSGGVVLATGSIYLIADLLRPADEARASVL